MNTRQVSLIAKYSARYSVRGGVGLVFLLLSLTFGLIVAHTMLQPVEMITKQVTEGRDQADEQQVREDVLTRLVSEVRPAVAWFLAKKSEDSTAADDEKADLWADYLLNDRPAVLSAIFLILLFGWPFIVAMGAFDLYAGDIASRQLRYQLLRADRASIFFGRLIGTIATFVFVLLLLGVTVALYMGFKLPFYSWGDLIAWSAYGVVALVVMSLPYIALSSWISASVASPFGSLTLISLVIGGVPLFAKLGGVTHEAVGHVIWLLPWGFQTYLFSPSFADVALAVAGCVGMTLLFGWLGYRKFTTRDL